MKLLRKKKNPYRSNLNILPKKIEDKPLFLDNGDGLICIQEILFSLKKISLLKMKQKLNPFQKYLKAKHLTQKRK